MSASANRIPRRLLIPVFGLGLIVASVGCSRLSLHNEIANRGPVRLDEKNPYLVSNQFLAETMKASPTARGFVRTEGTPDAIAVKKSFLGPYRTHFYYLPERRAFLMERKGGQAIIKGPARIPESVYRKLKRIKPLSREAALTFNPGGPTVAASADRYHNPRAQMKRRSSPGKRPAVDSYKPRLPGSDRLSYPQSANRTPNRSLNRTGNGAANRLKRLPPPKADLPETTSNRRILFPNY